MRTLRARLNNGTLVLSEFSDPVFDGTEMTIIYDPWPLEDRAWETREVVARLQALGKAKASQILFELERGKHLTVFLPVYTDGSSTSWFRTLRPKTFKTIKAALAAEPEQLSGMHVMTIDCSTVPRDEYGEPKKKIKIEEVASLTMKSIVKAMGWKLCLPLSTQDGADYFWAGPASLK